MIRYCQECGHAIFGHKGVGLEKNGRSDDDFCCSCYRFGKFLSEEKNSTVFRRW